MEREPSPALIGGALTLAVASMSTAALLIRLVGEAGPLTIAFYRMAFATLLLAPWAWAKHRAELRDLPRRDALLLAGIGVVLGLHFATWITSLRLTTVASSVVLVTLHPAIVGLLGAWLLREAPARRAWAGIGIAILGALLLVRGDYALSGQALLGDGLAFAGAVFAAVYFLGGRQQRRKLSLPAYAIVVYASASITLLLLALGAREPLQGLPLRDLLLCLGLAVGPQLFGHTVANWSLRWVPASLVSTAIVGEPIGSAFLAWLVLAEVPPVTSLLGGAIILAGVYLVASSARTAPARVAPVVP